MDPTPVGIEDEELDLRTIKKMEAVQKVVEKTSSNSYTNMNSARRLTRELLAVYETQTWDAELVDDNLYEWIVRISPENLDQESLLVKDLLQQGADKENRRSSDIELKCKYLFDGALCMELLIHWNPAHAAVEAILLQICTILVEGQARLESAQDGEYSEERARESFQHLKTHHDKNGWKAR